MWSRSRLRISCVRLDERNTMESEPFQAAADRFGSCHWRIWRYRTNLQSKILFTVGLLLKLIGAVMRIVDIPVGLPHGLVLH